MNCPSAREVFPELLARRTAATAHLEARAHLACCPDCQREFASLSRTLDALDTLPANPPSGRMRKGFYAMLEEEKHSAASVIAAERRKGRPHDGRTLLWRWVLAPLAGCALLAAGFLAGQRTLPNDAAPQLAASGPTSSETAAMRQELTDLRAQVSKMGTLVGYSLLQQQRPANERLRGILTSASLEDPNEAVINELISALAFDTSPNVRLSALEGLYPHAEQEVVRAGVLASLPREQNPLVQVSMIDFLAAARDAEAKPTLEKISSTEAVDRNVRDAARRALTQL
ncbi:MAG: HEAT repeat domain-containing protein [Opitutus sp.]